jgi:hypothetical protein
VLFTVTLLCLEEFRRGRRRALLALPLAVFLAFVVAPLLTNGMAVIGDAEKFVTMAEMRIPTVEVTGDGLRVGVVSNHEWNPITVGYAGQPPVGVEVGNEKLEEASSLARLQAAKSGWFWDHQTNLWHVKLDFGGVQEMTAGSFYIH